MSDDDPLAPHLDFASSLFDVKAWLAHQLATAPSVLTTSINRTIETSTNIGNDATISHLQSLMMTLGLQSSECQSMIDHTSQALIQATPRACREMMTLKREANALRLALTSNSSTGTVGVDQSHQASLSELAQLDTVKQRLVIVRSIMERIDASRKRAAQVESVIDSGDLHRMAATLKSMRNSIVLKRCSSDGTGVVVPEHLLVNEHDLLERLESRVSALSAPSIQSALEARDLTALAALEDVLELTGESDSVIVRLYIDSRIKVIESVLTIADIEQLHSKFVDFLSDERQWSERAFPSPLGPMIALISMAVDRLVTKETEWWKSQPTNSAITPAKQRLQFFTRVNSDNRQLTARLASMLDDFPMVDQCNAIIQQCLLKPFYVSSQDFAALIRAALVKDFNAVDLGGAKPSLIAESLTQSLPVLTNACVAALDDAVQSLSLLAVPDVAAVLDELVSGLLVRATKSIDQLREASTKASTSDGEEWNEFHGYFQLLKVIYRTKSSTIEEIDRAIRELTVREILPVIEMARTNEITPTDIIERRAYSTQLKTELKSLQSIEKWLQKCQRANEKLLVRSNQCYDSAIASVLNAINASLFAPLQSRLTAVNQWPAWRPGQSAVIATEIRADGSEGELRLPSFTPQPSEPIIAIGEYLLSLVHQIEPIITDTDADSGNGSDNELDASGFMTRLSHQSCNRLIDGLLSLSSITDITARQIFADFEYLSNVLNAMAIPTPSTVTAVMQELDNGGDNGSSDELSDSDSQRVVATVRKLRSSTTSNPR